MKSEDSLPEGALFKHHQRLQFGVPSSGRGDFKIDCFNRKGQFVSSKNYINKTLTAREYKPQQPQNMYFWDHRFKQDFAAAKNLFTEGKLEKAVLFNTLEITLKENFSLDSLLSKIANLQSSHYLYGQWRGDRGFIGLSPEHVFSKEANSSSYQAMALAGTATAEEKESLLSDKKLKKEQALVVDHYVNFFREENLPFEQSPSKIQEYQNIYHLKHEFKFQYQGNNQKLLEKLSPTPAVGVFPKSNLQGTWEAFDFNNHADHDLYGGVFLKSDEERLDAVVMIRKICWHKNRVLIHAGCGVVAESELEQELKESKLKIAKVMELFL